MLVRDAIWQKKTSPSPTSAPQDEAIITACLAGDEGAWERLIAKYSRLVYSIPFRYGLMDDEAADVFQSVCLKLLENLHTLRDHTKLSSWLITTTTRECWSVTRKRARISQRSGDSEDDDNDQLDTAPLPEEVAMSVEEQQAVREAVQDLPPRCQRLLGYLFYDRSGLSYAEVGRRLGVPDGSVGPLRARCLEKLRVLLEEADRA